MNETGDDDTVSSGSVCVSSGDIADDDRTSQKHNDRASEIDNNRNENHNRVSEIDNDRSEIHNRESGKQNRASETHGKPLGASTPRDKRVNGHALRSRDVLDNRDGNCNTVNGNVHVTIVSASTNNMDVLSGGESDADTLSRRNNNSVSSQLAGSLRRRGGDVTYYVAKELLMTERTYKRDLDLVTVSWSGRVGNVAGAAGAAGSDGAALARACLALEPLALPAGALLARLDRALAAASPHRHQEMEEPEYKKIAELLCDYLSSTYDAYMSYVHGAGAAVAVAERSRRRGGAAAREAAAFDCTAPLPLACLLLRPLHRLLHYKRLAAELFSCGGSGAARSALQLAGSAADAARAQLPHAENHAALCQLQRDITGYDKLLVPGREFIRLGCVYKHSSKGLLQRMLFLFSDLLLVTSKTGGGQFKVHLALALHELNVEPAELNNSLTISGESVSFVISVSSEGEYSGWRESLEHAIMAARDDPADVDTELAHNCEDNEESSSCGTSGVSASSALAQVCWHRAASLTRESLHLAYRTQLSGYLLRKFKNSHGWQKLWVVFAMFTLHFYKSWQDEAALASLPLLGYSVGPPARSDGIDKEFVFKLQFKNHVYFFRADSHFTYNRWTEVLQTPSLQSHHN